ncbi:MAG: hypothetical protein M1496_06850 [Candidatus Thermoplasmatota archaeon]|jgi:hypothetical protein|nr:hypothetical protein [Candidatus Thermoplasmatota archaeon]
MENKNENMKHQEMEKMNCGCHGKSMNHEHHERHGHGCRHGESGRGMGRDNSPDLESYKEKLEQEISKLQDKLDNLKGKSQENPE